MTDLRTAAQQALEALTPFVRGNWTPGLAVQAAAAMACLESALAEPVEPGCRDDGMPTSAEERHLRRLLALRAAMPHAYYDDGEAQGTEHGISIDFMREPVAHIDAKLRALNVARAIAKQSEPVQEPDPGEYHGWVLREVLFEKGEPVGHREPVQEPVAQAMQDAVVYGMGISHGGKR